MSVNQQGDEADHDDSRQRVLVTSPVSGEDPCLLIMERRKLVLYDLARLTVLEKSFNKLILLLKQ